MKTRAFEQLPFSELHYRKGRAEHGRQVFVSADQTRLYKLWYPEWEWADVVAQAYEAGYYDETWPKGVEALVTDQAGKNRGYIMRYVPPSRHLASFAYPRFSRHGFKTFFSRRHQLNADFLRALLSDIFLRARESGYLFTEVSIPNLWISNDAYHIFDLDSIRPVDWLFEQDPTKPDFIRRVINRQAMFDGLEELLQLHGITVPPRPSSAADLEQYFE